MNLKLITATSSNWRPLFSMTAVGRLYDSASLIRCWRFSHRCLSSVKLISMNYSWLDPWARYVGSRKGATIWWCSPYEVIWCISILEKLIGTSRRGEVLWSRWIFDLQWEDSWASLHKGACIQFAEADDGVWCTLLRFGWTVLKTFGLESQSVEESVLAHVGFFLRSLGMVFHSVVEL